MVKKLLSGGVVHVVPSDLRSVLFSNPSLVSLWNGLTPLARNEWLCWVLDAKKQETRELRVMRVCEDLMNGKRRPCCWAGCKHQTIKG